MRTLTALVLCIFVLVACKKNDLLLVQAEPYSSNAIQQTDTIVFYDTAAVKDNPVCSFRYNEKQLNFNFYGNKTSSGKIKKITACTVTNLSNPDTVYNFSYDDSGRVQAFYFSVKGKKDTSVVKCFYRDSSTLLVQYGLTWKGGLAVYRGIYQISPNHLNDALFPNSSDQNKQQINNAINNIYKLIGGIAIIAPVLLPAVPVWVAFAGLGVLIVGKSDITWTDVNNVAYGIINAVKGAVSLALTVLPTLPENPSSALKKIKSPEWFYCACSFHLPTGVPLGGNGMGVSFSPSPDDVVEWDWFYGNYFLDCDGNTIYSSGGINFILKNGTSVTVNGWVQTSSYCGDGHYIYASQDYGCP